MRNPAVNNSGMTILEVITAIALLAIAAGSIFMALFLGIDIVNETRENIIASSIIQQEIETLRKTFFVSLPGYGSTNFSSGSLPLLYNSTGTVKIDPYIDTNIVRVVVEVKWFSRLNTSKLHVQRAATLITKNGINSI